MTKRKTTLPPTDGHPPQRSLLDQAEDHFEKSEYEQAQQLADEVLEGGNGLLSKHDEVRARCILGECFESVVRYDDALAQFQSAAAIAEAASNRELQSRAMNGIADLHVNLGDFGAAIHTAEGAIALAQQAGDKRQEAVGLNTIGYAHCSRADSKLALEHYNRALVIAREIGDKQILAATLGKIGSVYTLLANHSRALEYYRDALARYEGTGNKRGIAATLGGMGIIFKALGDYSRSLDFLTRSLALKEEIGDKKGIGTSLLNIGVDYDLLEDHTRALEYYSRSLSIGEEIGDKELVAISFGNIGRVNMASGDYVRAMEYLPRALVLSQQIGARRPVGFWMAGIAKTQQKMGNLETAYQGFLELLHYRRDVLESKEGVAMTLYNIGDVLMEQAKPDEALLRFQEALSLADETGEKYISSNAHEEISRVYATMGDMAKAYGHITKHNALEKEIHTEELKKRVDIFNMRVAIAEIEHGVEVQKLHIEHMEHDLANSAIHLAAQTDLLDHFRLDLSQIFREIEEPITAMKRIKEKLKALPCQQIDWPKFEGQFNEVHPEFKEKLSAKFPDLTQMEERIAAMVRMDLKSSDIARLFCITERAVEFHRLNLRKKLKLDASETLPKVLSQL